MSSGNIYLFTGKGGVGKTITSKSFFKSLGKNTEFISLAHEEESPLKNFTHILEDYLKRKFKSKTVAKLLASSKFISAILNIIPNFYYLIFWGNILEKVSTDQIKNVVIDAPSTGHALSLLNSPWQFSKLFQKGILKDDCEEIKKLIKQHVYIYYISLPNELNISEMKDFKTCLNQSNFKDVSYIINQSYSEYLKLKPQNKYLKNIVKNETFILKNTLDIDFVLPMIPLESKEIINELAQSWKHE